MTGGGDDRNARSDLADAANQFVPFQTRHLDVGDDRVGGGRIELLQRFEPVCRLLDSIAFVLEEFGQLGTIVRLVVDDQNF